MPARILSLLDNIDATDVGDRPRVATVVLSVGGAWEFCSGTIESPVRTGDGIDCGMWGTKLKHNVNFMTLKKSFNKRQFIVLFTAGANISC